APGFERAELVRAAPRAIPALDLLLGRRLRREDRLVLQRSFPPGLDRPGGILRDRPGNEEREPHRGRTGPHATPPRAPSCADELSRARSRRRRRWPWSCFRLRARF